MRSEVRGRQVDEPPSSVLKNLSPLVLQRFAPAVDNVAGARWNCIITLHVVEQGFEMEAESSESHPHEVLIAGQAIVAKWSLGFKALVQNVF